MHSPLCRPTLALTFVFGRFGQKRKLELLVGRILGCPLHLQFPLGQNTFPEIQVDEVLIGNAGLFRHRLKVRDDVYAHADCELLLEPPSVRIRPTLHLAEVIFIFHGAPSG